MKNLLITLLLLLAAGFTGQAQSLTLTDDAGPLANGSMVVQSGPSDTLQLITWLYITNQSANTLRVLMKKEEISMLPGTNSSICWAGYCYGPEMTVSTFPLVMLPGEMASGCFGHFGPGGQRGVSRVRWTFFSESDYRDSLSITVDYSTFPAAANDLAGALYQFTATGSLQRGNPVSLRYSIPAGKHGNIEIRNSCGKQISSPIPVSLSGTYPFNTCGLPAGIYFCTLRIDGINFITRKIPIVY